MERANKGGAERLKVPAWREVGCEMQKGSDSTCLEKDSRESP